MTSHISASTISSTFSLSYSKFVAPYKRNAIIKAYRNLLK
jgi:hypothetical protein